MTVNSFDGFPSRLGTQLCKAAIHGVMRADLMWVQELHILSQLAVAAVLAVGHQVDEAVALLPHREGLALHLIHPASGNKAHNLMHDNASLSQLEHSLQPDA